MDTLLIKSKLLNHNIVIAMNNNLGTSVCTGTGYTTTWVDDIGEEGILEIAVDWLRYQSSMRIADYEDYSGHRWWKEGYTEEERERATYLISSEYRAEKIALSDDIWKYTL